MADVTRPFQNKLWYYDEATFGTCPVSIAAGTARPISCEWRVARMSAGDKHAVNYGASTPAPTTLWEQVDDYRFHLEYVPQCDDTLLSDCINRQTDAYDWTCHSFSFMLGLNTHHQSVAAGGDQSWFEICGAKADTIRLSSSRNNKWVVAIDFLVVDILTDGDASFITSFVTNGLTDLLAEEPAALTGAYLGFNVAGRILKGAASFAYIVDSADITIEHNLNADGFDHDSKARQYAVEGRWAGSGSIDMSLDEGGGVHWYQVMNREEFSVTVSLGAVGCPEIILPSCQWVNPEISVEVEDSQLMRSASFNSCPSFCSNADSLITNICKYRT